MGTKDKNPMGFPVYIFVMDWEKAKEEKDEAD